MLVILIFITMKKITILTIIAALTLVSCGDKKETTDPGIGQQVTLNKESLALKPDAVFLLEATIKPIETPDATKSVPSWRSTDETVAAVSESGLVTAKSFGKTLVIASFGSAADTCMVNVLDAPKVDDFYYSDGSWSTVKDETKTCVGLVYAVNFNRNSDPTDPKKQDVSNPEYRNLVMGFAEQEDTFWDLNCNRDDPSSPTALTHLSLYNGEYNKNDPAILNDLATFSVFHYAENLAKKSGLNWYVPSYYELRTFVLVFNGGGIDKILYTDKALQQSLLPMRKAYNEKLKNAGGDKAVIKYITDADGENILWSQTMYWTSSIGKALVPEYDHLSALALYMYTTGTDITPYKDNGCNVRPILAFEY